MKKTAKKLSARRQALLDITKNERKNYIYKEKKILTLCNQPKRLIHVNFI